LRWFIEIPFWVWCDRGVQNMGDDITTATLDPETPKRSPKAGGLSIHKKHKGRPGSVIEDINWSATNSEQKKKVGSVAVVAVNFLVFSNQLVKNFLHNCRRTGGEVSGESNFNLCFPYWNKFYPIFDREITNIDRMGYDRKWLCIRIWNFLNGQQTPSSVFMAHSGKHGPVCDTKMDLNIILLALQTHK